MWKAIPWKVKEGVTTHETRDEALDRAQRIANKTGDWVRVEQGDEYAYIQPNTKPRRRR